MKRGKVTIISIMALSVLVSGCGESSGSGTLKVGVRDNIVNLGYLNPTTEQYYGLEIDLADLLAKDLGYESAELVSVYPEDREEKLTNGDVDCLIAAYTITDERKETYDFSPSYYTAYSRVMVETSTLIDSVDDLKGKTIGVRTGTNADSVLNSWMASDNAVTYAYIESYDELSKALEEGTIDAACLDGCIAREYLNDGRILLDEKLQEENYGVATQKGSSLSEPVAKSIQKMLDDGTVEELVDKWN